jgi:hypothetical protein
MLNRFCDVPTVAIRSVDVPSILNSWRDVPINDIRVVTMAGFVSASFPLNVLALNVLAANDFCANVLRLM